MPRPIRQIRNNERFQLKLTEPLLLEGDAVLVGETHLDSSLAYTNSNVSIVMDQAGVIESQGKGNSKQEQKEASTKATTLFNSSNNSVSARESFIYCRRARLNRQQQRPKNISFHQISLQKKTASINLPLIHAKQFAKNIINPANYKRSVSCRINHKSIPIQANSVRQRVEAVNKKQNLRKQQRTLQVVNAKGMKLGIDQQKGNAYLRKIIQNRLNMANPFKQQLELPSIKKGKRIHLPC